MISALLLLLLPPIFPNAAQDRPPPVTLQIGPAPALPAPPDETLLAALPDYGPNSAWIVQPMAEFPERAAARDVRRGRVRLTCTGDVTGQVTACRIDSEDPVGVGFGREAVRGALRGRVAPLVIDGAARDFRLTFTLGFTLEPEPPAEE